MAKDDYFVIVYKILAYLYVQLKSGENIDEKLISTDGPLCQINEKYWTYIWVNLIKYDPLKFLCILNEEKGKYDLSPEGQRSIIKQHLKRRFECGLEYIK